MSKTFFKSHSRQQTAHYQNTIDKEAKGALNTNTAQMIRLLQAQLSIEKMEG